MSTEVFDEIDITSNKVISNEVLFTVDEKGIRERRGYVEELVGWNKNGFIPPEGNSKSIW